MTDRSMSSPSPPSRDSTAIPPRRPGRGRRRRGRGDESGAALVEFALVFPLFVFVLYGLITFGVTLAQKQNITNAAADGARAAVGAVAGPAGGGPVGETQAAAAARVAQARVQAALGAPGNYTATYVPASCGSRSCITVTISYDRPIFPALELPPPLPRLAPPTFKSTAVVQYA